MARLHALIGEQLGEDADDSEVVIGTETDRGPWVAALVAAGYTVYAREPAAGLPLPGRECQKVCAGGGKQERFRRPQGVAWTMGRSR